jgi:hypothetical protein
MMILADTVRTLTSLTATSLAQVMTHSGYRDSVFKSAEFVGITNGGEFAYRVTFDDPESNKLGQSKVYVRYDAPTGLMVASI